MKFKIQDIKYEIKYKTKSLLGLGQIKKKSRKYRLSKMMFEVIN